MDETAATRARHTRLTVFGLVLLLLAGFVLRVWDIERHGLWIDEIATAQCLAYELPKVFECRRAQLGSPVFHVATNLVYTVAGRPPLPAPEWLVRLPELLAGTFTILAAWLAARSLLGTRGAWLNAVLWTFAPTAIAYSQEARMYAWLMLFANLSTWLLVEAIQRRSWKWAVAFAVVAALNFYSHYLAVFIIAGQFLFAAVLVLYHAWTDRGRGQPATTKFGIRRETWRLAAGVVLAGIVLVLLLIPWVPNILGAAQTHVLSGTYTREALDLHYLTNAASWIALNGVELPGAAFALLVVQMLGVWWLYRNRRMTLALVGCWFAVTFGFLLYRMAGFSAFRYWMVVQVPAYLLLTAGGLKIAEGISALVARNKLSVDRRVPYALVAGVGVLLLLPSLAQFWTDPFESYRFDDWRGVTQYLRANAKPTDLVIGFGDASIYHKLAFDFYMPPDSTAPPLVEPDEIDANLIAQARTEPGRAWGLVYAREPETVAQWRALGKEEVELREFHGLVLVSPQPASAQETVAESTARLVTLYRSADPDRFGLAQAILTDIGQGENLLANPTLQTRKGQVPQAWKFGVVRPRVVESDGVPALELRSEAADDTVTTSQYVELQAGHYYILRYECRSSVAGGAQRTYVTFDQPDHSLIVFPNGAGDVCANDVGWQEQGFVVHVPEAVGGTTANVLLRNGGAGDALWRKLTLYEIPPP